MNAIVQQRTWLASPNIWLDRPVVHFSLNSSSSLNQPGITPQGVAELSKQLGLDISESLASGDSIASFIAEAVLAVQQSFDLPVWYSLATHTTSSDQYEIAIQYCDRVLAEIAIDIVLSTISTQDNDHSYASDMQAEWQRLNVLRDIRFPNDVSMEIVKAAEARSIPWTIVDPQCQYIELGTGAYRTRFNTSVTDKTSINGVRIAQDKNLVSHLLRTAGLPVPQGFATRSFTHALLIATDIGYPVAVKPVDGGASAGVSVNVFDDDELKNSYDRAMATSHSGRVLVERFIPHHKYRVTVINGCINSIFRHDRAAVTGDSQQTIAELIACTNRDSRRGVAAPYPLRTITIDDDVHQMLAKQEFSLDSVPDTGQHVVVKSRARRDEGGWPTDVTDNVHPDTAAMLCQAVGVLGLDVATIDFIAESISRSCWETDCGIIDINTGSEFSTELNPLEGEPRSPGPAIIDMLFPPGQLVRAPIIAVSGEANRAAVCLLLKEILAKADHSVGITAAGEIHLNGIHLRGIDGHGSKGPQIVLHNPDIQTAILEVEPQRIIAEGLGFSYCDIAVIPHVSKLSPYDLGPPEKAIFRIMGKESIVILNADDPSIELLLPEIRGEIIFIAQQPANPLVAQHLQQGGRAVVLTENHIALFSPEPPVEFHLEPNVSPEILELLATLATATALRIPWSDIRIAG